MSVDPQYSGPIQALEELERKLDKESREVTWSFGQKVSARTIETREGSYSVAKVFMPSGAEFPQHIHGETEWLLVTEGRAIHHAERTETEVAVAKELGRGGCAKIDPGRAHRMEALEDTWILAITIPDSEAFAK